MTGGADNLSHSLLLEILNRQSVLEANVARTEQQNVLILDAHRSADQSRARIHTRIDEMSANVASLSADVNQQGERLEALDPVVQMLKDAHVERNTIRRVIKDFCKNGYVIGGTAITVSGTVWHQWDVVRAAVLRLLGAKVGGP